jgi:hypothetical protein
MALVSPGVEVSIIDQSQYLPTATSSVPLLVVATAQNKANASNTDVAAATTASNANKLYQVTSQRDLVNLYGTPFFYKTATGTPIQGYELNEYGLLAAYSLLGATNRCFILRADIDLGSLVGTLGRPIGDPVDGTYWLDTVSSKWGIFEFNRATGQFAEKTPLVITEAEQIVDDFPAEFLGTIGSYAVIPTVNTDGPINQGTYFLKTLNNSWVRLGSQLWKQSIVTVQGTVSFPSFTINSDFTINVNGEFTKTVNITSGDTISDVVAAINALNIGTLTAQVSSGRIQLYYGDPAVNSYVTLTNGTNNPLTTLGITAGTYYGADVVYGTSAQMPLWTSSQTAPHPSGSVWIKTSVAGSGVDLNLSQYSQVTDTWNSIPVAKYASSVSAIYNLDPTGGQAIPEGTVYARIGTDTYSGMMLLKRKATGPTLITGTVANPTITPGLTLSVRTTVPNSSVASASYTVTMTGSDAESFVTDWLNANIPFTYARVLSNGVIQLEHTAGGDLYIGDATLGVSNGLLASVGLGFSNPDVVKEVSVNVVNANATASNTVGNDDAVLNVVNNGRYYTVSITNPGTGYTIGDTLTILGSTLGGENVTNDLVVRVQQVDGLTGAIQEVSIDFGIPKPYYVSTVSNWEILDYIPNEGQPATNPVNGTNWFYSTATEVDIMINQGGVWKGYRNQAYDLNGQPVSGAGNTDPLGPIMSTTSPLTQTDGTALVYGDLWLDTSDLENYPKLSRWQAVNGTNQWVEIDNTDQTSQFGVLFADARWANNGTVDPVNDPLVSISTLLTSNYTDLDCPNPLLYPQGMLLFNTRRSGYNVKQFRTNYFTNNNYPGQSLPTYSYTWVSASGLKTDGSPYMGRKAQRNMVVQAMKAAVSTNQTIREEDTFFNLMACPNYPELQPEMVTLNNDRNNTAYIIGDTPLRLADQATNITNWATNAAGSSSTGEDGLVTRDPYMGLFYPSGIATDLTGAQVVVPASHMMLRTFLRNDTIAYPWLAPAGTRRGNIDNATAIGYLDPTTGEFVTVKNRMSIRDVLYTNQINPLAFFTGVGLLNYGNKNSQDTQSALDRINVARLVCYLRERLQVATRPFVFEPNDSITRNQITGVVQSLLVDLVAKRGLFDYLVVCDETNNTPARIDRNELWIDVAIEPVKAAEFIYIPVRVLNTGELAELR